MASAPDNIKSALAAVGRDIDEFGHFSIEVADDRSHSDLLNNRPGSGLREKILALPESPGVYIYLDKNGSVIYVGKAKRLRRRVSSYFNRRHDSRKTNLLVRNIADMRFIVVASEEDALHLENAMIKEYQPRYNVLLKDDKSYPWIVVTNEMYPRVFMTRERSESGRYYGPYANVQAARLVLELVREMMPLRSCRHAITPEFIARGKGRLCLDYHIHKCGGACKGMVSAEEYGEMVARVRHILNGETRLLLAQLRFEMQDYAAQLRFEEAQAAKDTIALLEKFETRRMIGSASDRDTDLFGYAENDRAAFVSFMHLRHGAVVQSLNLEYRKRMAESRSEILSMAIGEIQQRFGRTFTEVLVPFEPDMEFEGVSFRVPLRGAQKKVLEVGEKNARQFMADKEREMEKLNPDRRVERLMERMKSDFRLSEQPRHIECFDNSNTQGTNPVASCVVFRNGRPSRRDYRHFNIRTVVGADDFASMKEVLHRRYTRLMAEGEELPQLVVVDGGKGQLSAAVEAFDEMGLRGRVALVGIAKRLEEIYFPGDTLPLYIDKQSESLRVIQALRDEAHRFGITHHRLRRSKGQVRSELDDIKGIGPATQKALMRRFKSLKRLREAPASEIEKVIGKARAVILLEGLGRSFE